MNFIIAIDGPAGSGKSTISKIIAQKHNLTYLDTGAMYRMIAFQVLNDNIDLNSSDEVKKMLDSINIDIIDGNFFIDGHDVSTKIRTPEVTAIVSEVAAIKDVRTKLVHLQREISKNKNVILDGRDIGTVVFKNADLKIFLVADQKKRAKRRVLDFAQQGITESFEKVLDEIIKRDKFDSSRLESPLKKASDAIELDSSNIGINTVVGCISQLIIEKKNSNNKINNNNNNKYSNTNHKNKNSYRITQKKAIGKKKIIYGMGFIIILAAFFLFKPTHKNSYERQINLEERLAIKQIIGKITNYSKTHQKKIKHDGLTYSFYLNKKESLNLDSDNLQTKEIQEKDRKKIIYTDSKGNIKLIINITYFTPPKLAILIDNLGMNSKIISYFKLIDKPLSFAVPPFFPKSRETAKMLRESGFEVILHLPVEGNNYILNKNTKGIILTSMDKTQIYDKFDQAIENIGGAKGFITIHGSLFTENSDKMSELLSYGKRKNMFFIDTILDNNMSAFKLAKNLQIPTYCTLNFFDNSYKKEDIKTAIKEAIIMAKKNKKNLIIGHCRRETAEAIFEMLDDIQAQGVELVPLDQILE